MTKYRALVQAQRVGFLPIAIETFGGLAKGTAKLIAQLVYAAQQGAALLSPHALRRSLQAAVAVQVQAGNARAILACHAYATTGRAASLSQLQAATAMSEGDRLLSARVAS